MPQLGCAAIARALVAAKIVNMRGLVRRRADLTARGQLSTLQRHAAKPRHTDAIGTLLGLEARR